MDINHRGCIAEYDFATECMKRGIEISFPLLHTSIYDCIIDFQGRLLKIQIKSTGQDLAKHRRTVQVAFHGAYPKDKVDYFAIYVDLFSGFFIFPNNGTQQSVRLNLNNINSKYYNNFSFTY